MQLTKGAISALLAGALTENLDVNAVDADGKEYHAPQICCEDDKQIRAAIELEEYNPVLEVVSTTWYGCCSMGLPVIEIMVKDANGDEMLMMATNRNRKITKAFLKRWGNKNGRKLNPGVRFKLLDYTTKVRQISQFNKEEAPIIFVESIRVEPKPKIQSKMTSWLAKNKFGN